MATDIHTPPISEKFVDHNGFLTPHAKAWVSDLYEMIRGYLGTTGIQFPQMTVNQRNEILNPPNGLIIHNITSTENELYLNGWKTINHT